MASAHMSLRRFSACTLILLILSGAATLSAQQPSAVPPPPPDAQAPPPPPPPPPYNDALFARPVPPPPLAFLTQTAGMPSGRLYGDRRFHAILHAYVPRCTFHYGRDMSITDALSLVIPGSRVPVQVQDNRYVVLSGHRGPYLNGRAFLWIDTQNGIFLGAFYFHPTNGEPTPTLAVFSRQLQTQEKVIESTQLPPVFMADLSQWQADNYLPPLVTRYFLTGTNDRILLEHAEDYCAPQSGDPAPPSMCEQMNATAADLDMNAAYYLEQVDYATNATAWMITGADQQAWLTWEQNSCAAAADQLACRIRLTRSRTWVIIRRRPIPHIAHPAL